MSSPKETAAEASGGPQPARTEQEAKEEAVDAYFKLHRKAVNNLARNTSLKRLRDAKVRVATWAIACRFVVPPHAQGRQQIGPAQPKR